VERAEAQVSSVERLDRAYTALPMQAALKNTTAGGLGAAAGRHLCTPRMVGRLRLPAGSHRRVEIMLDPIMEVWDCGPFPPIFSEAGGYFGDWKGNVTIYGREGLATTQKLLPEVLKILGEG